MNGAGENLVWSAGDFEDFYEPRPDLPETMEAELQAVVEHLVEKKWPFRIHATYDESISRLMDVFERINEKKPFGTRFIIDHAETVSEKNIERIGALGGGICDITSTEDAVCYLAPYDTEDDTPLPTAAEEPAGYGK